MVKFCARARRGQAAFGAAYTPFLMAAIALFSLAQHRLKMVLETTTFFA
jgi:hypothetical protein